MQADGSVVALGLVVVVGHLLARSLTNVVHGGLLVAHLYSTQSTHFPVRLPTTTRLANCYENDSRHYRTWSGERAVRDTHHGS